MPSSGYTRYILANPPSDTAETETALTTASAVVGSDQNVSGRHDAGTYRQWRKRIVIKQVCAARRLPHRGDAIRVVDPFETSSFRGLPPHIMLDPALPTIRLVGLHKSFSPGTHVLDGVSFDVASGEICGVVGHSGAGKSTLVRCVNLLERPDLGRVEILGHDLMTLDEAGLRKARRGIGMVFQHFNLLSSRTVAQNVAFPLEITGIGRAEREGRVMKLLGVVGLSARRDAYPAQLSGGEKQRVGIARALASRPQVLLCDEATSALDPETTTEILGLLRNLSQTLSLSVLLITHEMAVVKSLCHRVIVLEKGKVLEQGGVFEVFTRPREALTRRFVAEVVGGGVPNSTLMRLPKPNAGESCVLLRAVFAGPNSTRAAISEASRRFGIDLNILAGRVDEIAGEPFGVLSLAAYGVPQTIGLTRAWLLELGIVTEIFQQGD